MPLRDQAGAQGLFCVPASLNLSSFEKPTAMFLNDCTAGMVPDSDNLLYIIDDSQSPVEMLWSKVQAFSN